MREELSSRVGLKEEEGEEEEEEGAGKGWRVEMAGN